MQGDEGQTTANTTDTAVLAVGVRAQLWPSVVAAAAVAAVTLFYAWRFSGIVAPHLLWPWVAAMAVAPVGIIVMIMVDAMRRPSDAEIVAVWQPVGRALRLVLNLAVIASPWIFLPHADAPLRALLLMLYVWFMATEVFANHDAGGMTWVALAGVPLSVGLYMLDAQVEHALLLTLFLLIAGATLFGVDRQMRASRIIAERAHLASAREAAALRASIREAEARREQVEQAALAPEALADDEAPRMALGAMAGRAPLTRRQIEVARLLAQGLSNKEIALRLDVSPATVKAHVAQVIAVTGARNRTGASARAQTLGLI